MAKDVRPFGMAKDGVIVYRFQPEVAHMAGGIPICHEVFDGNVAETHTLLPVLGTALCARQGSGP